MGNTILAHALYACSQLEFDPATIFSEQGNAHKISYLNQSNLIAWHSDSSPRKDVTPLLHVTSTGWGEVLRIKLSYAKWFLDTPAKHNFLKFGFTEPEDNSWLENLTVKYHTMLQLANNNTSAQPVLDITDYIAGNVDSLRSAVENIGWTWDSDRSDVFYQEMITHNRCYFDWLETIRTLTLACANGVPVKTELEFWEKALVIAKTCDIKNISPSSLHWDNQDCFLDTDSVTLIESFERIKNGKTI